mmetsp:Transcript_20416/g.57502  ORF Transcript_20416/g.57502 Transcript_20416/m.57502 type:complete len:625 (+) Transcript_20416:217-2091(+)|eukprot:CAMPEP_0119156624 /NCGR_PEP_ID=MMETSP1310-20130426/52349_1 /TAXON_ID=464262 /ORGANISM="Genus nov. species nov., Strain RCC2339" /LENGTH=624 /DNA_ID=CAMNT_0007149239 /DNA_START=147 /DNA_END=2021 /DNA_ORIENTATION=+
MAAENGSVRRRLETVCGHVVGGERLEVASIDAVGVSASQPAYGDFDHGGDLVAKALKANGVRFVFTLSGGHISPILVGCRKEGVRVVDVRHEVNAVFAADAVSRTSDSIGVACLTAGPGLTNTITAVKNAQLAKSPLLILGGATATLLKGRGALQDIDQIALFRPHVKATRVVTAVREIVPMIHSSIFFARATPPGPVFVELPLDILYPEAMMAAFQDQMKQPDTIMGRLTSWYIQRHIRNMFEKETNVNLDPISDMIHHPPPRTIVKVANLIARAERPVFVVGSQAVRDPALVADVAGAIDKLQVPTYLSGMARGLLGRDHPLLFRHQRRVALLKADLVVMLGVPFDFRLGYGKGIPSKTPVVCVNTDEHELTLNRKPTIPVRCCSCEFLINLANTPMAVSRADMGAWLALLRSNEAAREDEIISQAAPKCAQGTFLNPLHLLKRVEAHIDPNKAVLVADGGDFVGSASYIVKPRGPLGWLDPGPFGTLGVGAGFALGAKLVNPDAEVWIIWGDGSCGYSLMEYDTFVRHNVPVISVVGNDGCWSQIHRDQVTIFEDDVACTLDRCDYEKVAASLGGVGITVDGADDLDSAFAEAKRAARAGKPVLINARIGTTDFRKGSLSV